ncbi:enoyl-CoA hydratase/isomerase family protein [Chloroflexota bacterium]
MPRDYSSYKNMMVEVDEDSVATVTLNRPEVLNAQNGDSREELHRIWTDLAQDADVKVIIFTGAGRGFCAGGDIKEVASRHARGEGTVIEGDPGGPERVRRGGPYYAVRMMTLDKPIIGAINGVATGMGCVMALSCDIIIAADTAMFGDHHIRIGIVGGDGCCSIWPMLVGPKVAMEYIITGDLMSAQEADKRGLVNKVVPLTDLMPTAKALAKRLAHGPTVAIGLTKHSINRKVIQDWNFTQDFANPAERLTLSTEDHQEGSKAFTEKREPQFKGR